MAAQLSQIRFRMRKLDGARAEEARITAPGTRSRSASLYLSGQIRPPPRNHEKLAQPECVELQRSSDRLCGSTPRHISRCRRGAALAGGTFRTSWCSATGDVKGIRPGPGEMTPAPPPRGRITAGIRRKDPAADSRCQAVINLSAGLQPARILGEVVHHRLP